MRDRFAQELAHVLLSSQLRRRILMAVCFCLTLWAPSAQGQGFSDSFEFNSSWTVNQQNGSVGMSADTSHSGILSLKLSSTNGGQREISLTNTFPQATKGTVSVWFYDTAAGLQTLYSGLLAYNSSQPSQSFQVNVADWNQSNYVWVGPGVSETPTSVARTNGWHEFKLDVTAAGFDAIIDGTVVGSVAGDFGFDTVRLFLSGPGSAPNATFYFDDFTRTTYMPGPPALSSLVNVPATGALAGRAKPKDRPVFGTIFATD